MSNLKSLFSPISYTWDARRVKVWVDGINDVRDILIQPPIYGFGLDAKFYFHPAN